MVDVKRVVDTAKRLSGVVHAEDPLYTCSDLGQGAIKKAIEEHNLDRIVVSSCSPRMHEVTFQRCIESAGLNRCMFEMGNIREQCSSAFLVASSRSI